MPLNALGALDASSLFLIHENAKIIRINPRDVPIALAIEAANVKLESVFPWATPSTAQLVVISGR